MEQRLMETKASNGKWIKRVWTALGIAGALLALGAGSQLYAASDEAQRLRPPGKLIDVHGHKLHLHSTGQGRPTVVLEAGASAFSGVWEWIQPELAKHARVVSYDRAGLGFSESAEGIRDAASVARELDELLKKAGEMPPYVLVGHSYGALFVSVYAELYPQKVAGIVLVDGTHPDQVACSRAMRESR